MLLPDIAPRQALRAAPPPTARPTRCCSAASPTGCVRMPRRSPCSPLSRPTRSALADELAFFAPSLRSAVFPDWENAALRHVLAAPGPHLRTPRHALAHSQRRGRRGAHAGIDGAGAPGAAELHRRLHLPFQEQATARRSGAEGAAHAGRLHAREPGRVARRIRRSRRPDRPLPDGFAGALSRRPVRRRDRLHPHLRSRLAAQSLPRCPKCGLLPGREFPMDEAARTAFRSRWRERIEGDPTKVRIYKDIGAGIATAGIEYYLPLFFDETATVFDYLGDAATTLLARRRRRGAAAFSWSDTPATGTASSSTTASGPSWHRRRSTCGPRNSSPSAAGGRSWCCARVPATPAATWASAPARPERRPGCARAAEAVAIARRHDAASRPHRRRERGPAGKPARAAARQPHRAAERGDAGRVRGRRRALSPSPSRRWRKASRRTTTTPATRRKRSNSSPRPSCSR